MPRYCAQRFAWWWPLALAVFALSAFAAIALATGTAHADDGSPSSTGEAHSEKSAVSDTHRSRQNPESPSGSAAPASAGPATERSHRPSTGEEKKPTTRHLSTVPAKAETPRDDGPESVDKTPPAGTQPDSAEPVGTASASEPAEEPTEQPRSTRRTSQREHHPRPASGDTASGDTATNTPRASEPGDGSVPTTGTTSAPSAIRPAGATQHATTQQATANVVSLPTAQLTNAGTNAVRPTLDQKVAQFVRQVTGLASDLGIVGASLVNNLAVYAATAIGPQPLWGVPYAIANGIAGTAANASKVLSGTPLDAVSVGPFAVNYGVLDVLSFFTPTKVPAGANDPSITVTAAHPLPVILVNGTVETQSLNWSVGAPVLANAGYKVYTFNYGNTTPFPNYPIQSTADIRQSAAELSDEIDRVLLETGAPQVILIGHSQGGGITPAYYLNVLGGADKVSQFIGLAPSNHGTDVDGFAGLLMLPVIGSLLSAATDLIGPGLGQQLVTSSFQQVVYGKGDTQPNVLYTTIASTNDEVVTPYTQQALKGPNVTNIVLQDQYPGLPAGHIGVAFSAQAWASVLGALASNPQANPALNSALVAA